MRYIILIFSLLSILVALFFYQEPEATTPEKINQDYLVPFTIPVIYDSTKVFVDDSGETELTYSSVTPYGLFHFNDTIKISETSTVYEYKNKFEDHKRLWDDGPLFGGGLKLVADPNAWIPHESRTFDSSQPVYLVNETASPIILDAYFESRMITEAKDENGLWFPIEIASISMCGTGRHPTEIWPQEMLLVGMKKHSGPFKTKLRIRLKTGSQVIVSDPFPGSINLGQFYLSNTEMKKLGFGKDLKLTHFGVTQTFFLGALPKQAYELLYLGQ